MLQNRVDPLGRMIVTSARGLWMGNRGIIHNEHKQIVRSFKHKAWITCALQFKGRTRTVMTPGRWTELFFLDEATAFAAGHRPCFECRREDAMRFKSCWIKGNPEYNLSIKTSIQQIDDIIHHERINSANEKIMHQRLTSDIPEGTFIFLNDEPYLFHNNHLHRWTSFGYEERIPVKQDSMFTVITPHSIVNTFNAGYTPQVAIPTRPHNSERSQL